MSNYVANKVIVITGAGSGFGKILATRTAEMGAKVVCADVNADALNATVAELTEKGFTVSGIPTDVTKKDEVFAMAEFAVKTYGCIDVMVNNAGIMPLAFWADHKKALGAWDKCIDINLKGVMYGICAVYDQMMAQEQGGHIINISSIYGNGPIEGSAVYGMTKSGVGFLSDALRVETKGRIRVTTIRPTGCNTNLASTMINPEGGKGLVANRYEETLAMLAKFADGTIDPQYLDPEKIEYYMLDPKYLVDAIVAAINQPMGVSLSDITVRASGDPYTL